jgi:anti-anti-sigma regulatory factor
MIAPFQAVRRPAATERPMYQWEAANGLAAATLRLHGSLGRRELALVVETIAERARSPRDVISIDFENVVHLDFRALPEFVQRVARHRHRGASIWFVGLSPYARCLFDVAGQGSIVRQLAWQSEEVGRGAPPRRPFSAAILDGAPAASHRMPR